VCLLNAWDGILPLAHLRLIYVAGSPYSTGAEVPEGELTQSHTSCF